MPDPLLNRAANASIKGYLYQFDRTIIELLKAPSGTVVTVEGIEDIDIQHATAAEAVQCKYLEASKFSLAKIRPAVIPMLQSSLKDKSLSYCLYIFCGKDGTTPNALTLDELKQCLTSKNRKGEITLHYQGISDDDLVNFASRLSVIEGESFEVNRELVHTMIQAELRCTLEDSVDLYYGNALSAVNNLAIQGNIAKRKTTKVDFVKLIDTKEALYTRWHKEVVGVERYLMMLKRRAKQNQSFAPIMSRYLILGCPDILQKDDYVVIIEALAKRQYGIGKLSNAKPWTIIIDCDVAILDAIKGALIAAEIPYNDGYEKVSFSPALFNRWPVINTARSGKINVTSYDVRLLSATTYKGVVTKLPVPERVIAITDADLTDYGWTSPPQSLQVTGVSMPQIKELLGV